MTDKRHHDHKHPKVTTTHQDSGSVCTCVYRTQWSDCIRDELDGGRENAFVRGDGLSGIRRGSGKVPPSSGEAAAAAVRQLQNDPHNIKRMGDERRFADIGHHRFNGGPSPTTSSSSVKRRKTISAHVNNNSISRDALLPHIARNLLLAKLAPFLGTFTDTQSELQYSKRKNETKNMDVLVSHRKHRTRTEEEDSQKKDRHHHRHHRNGHKSDGELERERMRAKLRGGDKGKATVSEMERSSSDRGRIKEKAASTLPSEGSRKVETDEEKEERRRKRKERKEAEAFAAALVRLETDPIPSDCKRHRPHRRDSEKKSSRKESRRESDREGNLSSRSDKERQVVLARSKEKDSSKVSTRETLRPGVSTSSRRAESKQRATREAEKSSEHPKPVGEKEKEKEKDKNKEASNDRAVLGFVLEKKHRMVQCVSCLSDDVPRNQAAHLTACGHYFCNECLKRIFTLSLTDPALMPPKCCNSDHIPLKYVDRLLSYSTKKQWNKKYNEYTSSNRIYCPTKDCGHWISPKYISGKTGQCSRCKTKVCTMCNGKAHGASECPEDEDLKAFIKTAKENGYQKCYRCTAVVELKSGCNHITCRCTAEFCYRCGEKWKTCDCPWFAYPDSEEEEEDEQADPVVPARAGNEAVEAPRERRRREQREEIQQREEQERRDREAQIARDEILARQLAQASLFQDKETFEKLNGNGSLRTGLRNSYKKLAEEYAEERRRDEEAKEERVRDRLQKLRDRDSARRGSTSSNRESSRPSTARHERRHSEPRPLTSRGSHSRPQTAQALQTPPSPLTQEHHEEDAAQRRIFDDDRAARIAKYIMGELDELDDETAALPHSPVDEPAGSSPSHHRSHGERHRRGTVSGVSTRPSSSRRAEYGPDGRPILHTQQYHSTSKPLAAGFLPGSLPRLETPRYAASSVLADVSFPLENEKPSRSSSSHTRAGKIRENYIHANTRSAPTSPMHSTPPSALDNGGSARRNYLAELGYKFLKHQQHVAAPHSAYPLNYAPPAPAPAYTNYSYTSYSGFGADENNRARQFTQNWGGIEAMGPTWKEPFVDRLELSSRAPRVGAPRTTTY